MSDVFKRTGIIASIIIFILGFLAFTYCWKTLNVKNLILGSFYHEPEVVKISDFEYEIKSLLFTNSGTNENEYFATATAKPVSNFDRNKKYTLTINDIRANRDYGDYSYINANFTNTFISTQNKELLTDSLNIKVNFYTTETKIVFTTENGEQAISLWTSYIAKNGFVLKIIEDNYTPQIEADNLIDYKVDLYFEETIIKTFYHNAIDDFYLPVEYKGLKINSWRDDDNNYYTNSTRKELPLKTMNLYAVIDKTRLTFSFNKNTVIKTINNTNSNAVHSAKLYLNNYSIEDLGTDNIYSTMCILPENYSYNFQVNNFYVEHISSQFSKTNFVWHNSGDNFDLFTMKINYRSEATYKYNLNFYIYIKNNIATPYLEISINEDYECFNSFENDMTNNNINFEINIDVTKK